MFFLRNNLKWFKISHTEVSDKVAYANIVLKEQSDQSLNSLLFNYCTFYIFQKVIFCLALYTEEVNLQTFVMI